MTSVVALLASRERVRPARQYIGMEGERPTPGEGRIVDPADFEIAFQQHFPAIYRFISRRIGTAIGEDLAAETFATAYRRRASFEPGRGSLRSVG